MSEATSENSAQLEVREAKTSNNREYLVKNSGRWPTGALMFNITSYPFNLTGRR